MPSFSDQDILDFILTPDSAESLQQRHWFNAAKKGDTATLVTLLEEGVNPNVVNHLAKNALMVGILKQEQATVDLMLPLTDLKATVQGISAFMMSIRMNSPTMALQILNHNPDLSRELAQQTDTYGQTPLMHALFKNFSEDFLTQLIPFSRMDATNDEGNNALMIAVENNSLETIQLLLKNDPPLDVINIHQDTLLDLAKARSNPTIFQYVSDFKKSRDEKLLLSTLLTSRIVTPRSSAHQDLDPLPPHNYKKSL